MSKRVLDFNFGDIGALNGPISIRDVEKTVDEHPLSKRSVNFGFTLSNISITIKRGTEEVNEELSKRSEEYSLIIISLPGVNGLSGRSTDAYAGRHLTVSMRTYPPVVFIRYANFTSVADAMVQALQQNGVTQDQMAQYLSQTLLATDPETGNKYQLVPDNGSVLSSMNDIGEAFARELCSSTYPGLVLDLVYQPTSA